MAIHENIGILKECLESAWIETLGKAPNLNILKWFSLYNFAEEVKRSACANITNSSHHERTHKELKKASKYTNNHPDTLTDQIMSKAHKAAQSKDVVDALKSNKRNNTSVRDIYHNCAN